MELIKIAFFSACVSSGLSIMRNTNLKKLRFVFSYAFCTAFVFNFVKGLGYTFIAAILGGFVAAVLTGLSHRKGMHSYLFIVIPVIYCIGPGGALYKMFFGMLNFNWSVAVSEALFVLKDGFGIWWGIVLGTKLMNTVCKTKSEEF